MRALFYNAGTDEKPGFFYFLLRKVECRAKYDKTAQL
jgi:hypothetical protein